MLDPTRSRACPASGLTQWPVTVRVLTLKQIRRERGKPLNSGRGDLRGPPSPGGQYGRPAGAAEIPDQERQAPSTLHPGDIATTAFFLARQPRSAWSFEVDLRPQLES